MKFNEMLKAAMDEAGLNQKNLAALIGKSRASVSQYLTGYQIPTEETQREIALSMGLPEDYFKDNESKVRLAHPDGVQELPVETAAKLLHMNHMTVRMGLQQGVFPWGYAVHTSENRWAYFINAVRFSEIERIPLELVGGGRC